MDNKSEQINELAAALAIAQGRLRGAAYDANNKFLGNSYATIGSFIETAKPVLAECGLAVSQLVAGAGDGVGVTTILMHKSGQWLESTVMLPIGDEKGKSRAQVAGSIITYLRRYGYAGILGMYSGDEDDDGNGNGDRHQTSPRQAPRPLPQSPAKAPAPEPESPYNKPAREIVLKDLRAALKAAGGDPGTLYPSAIDTQEKLEHEIELTKQKLERQGLVVKHTVQPATA